MAFDERLAERVRELLASESGVSEVPMFGGLSFLAGGNLAVSVSSRGGLLVRVGAEGFDEALAHPGVTPMEMGKRRMKGWVFVPPEQVAGRTELEDWVERGVVFARSLPPKPR